jgi:hypothetical protein
MSWSGGTFTRTNGVYSGATVWFSDYSANVKIVYDRHDYHDQDLAQGINACINKNGQNSPTANIDWGGFKITGLAAGASSTDSARYGQTITAAAIDPSSKILTLTRADGNVTVDLTPIVVAGDTSDFARLSLGQTFAGQNTFTSLVQLQGSATWFGSNVAGFAATRFPAITPVTYGFAFAGLGTSTGIEFGFGLDGSSVQQAYIGGVRLLREGDVAPGLSASSNETISGNWSFTGSTMVLPPSCVFTGNGYSWSVTAPSDNALQFASSGGAYLTVTPDVTHTSKLSISGNIAWHSGNLQVLTAAPTGGAVGDLAVVTTGVDQGLWALLPSLGWTKIV